jgi:hypothetical protein
MLPGEIGFIARLGLLSGLREQELIYIKEKEVCVKLMHWQYTIV